MQRTSTEHENADDIEHTRTHALNHCHHSTDNHEQILKNFINLYDAERWVEATNFR